MVQGRSTIFTVRRSVFLFGEQINGNVTIDTGNDDYRGLDRGSSTYL